MHEVIDLRERIARPAGVRWLGHAASVIDLAGVRVATDPALANRLAHLRRHHTVSDDLIARTDIVVISHLHLDHLHMPSMRRFGKSTRILVPKGGGKILANQGFRNVVEVVEGESIKHREVTVDVVHAEHGSHRLPLSRHKAESVGYVVRGDGHSVYFAGDTDLYFDMMRLTDIDIAMIPIGGWASHLGPGHLNPVRAVQAARLIDPRQIIPIHWGTYSTMRFTKVAPNWLNRPVDEFRSEMQLHGLLDKARILQPGQFLSFEKQKSLAERQRRF